MKKSFLKLALAVLTIGLLGSCSKINERLDNLDKRVDGIENEQIASINSQISGITSSISDLGQIRSDISSLKQSAENHGQEIFALQEADETLGNRIVNLETYLDEVLPTFAETEWVEATFSTLEQYEETCDAIAEIDAKIGTTSEKLSKDIKACADSLTKWVNKTFEGYYTAAQMDAKLGQMKSDIDSARAAGKITDAKADSIAAELAKTKTAVDTAKANIRAEYKAAVKSAIETSEGKLTKALQDAITEVNGKIESLTTRVGKLETSVADLKGRVDKLEEMIQSVVIVPAYSDGSVKIANDSLYIDCIVSPSKAVANLVAGNVAVLVNKVKTKANTGVDTIKIIEGNVFEKDEDKGVISVRVFIKNKIPAADSTITVAVNVKKEKSDYTTEFVPVYVAGPALPEGALSGEFSVSAAKKVRFSQGNLVATIDANGVPTAWKFAANQYEYIGANVANTKIGKEAGDVDFFGWSTDAKSNNWGIHIKTSATKNFTTGNFKDWGKAVGDGNTWRTLSKAEWTYLVNKDDNDNIRKGKYKYGVTVCGKTSCLILAPDNFEGTIAESYDAAAWATAEAAGLVCLPAAGDRIGSGVGSYGTYGFYWTSSKSGDEEEAYDLRFTGSEVNPGGRREKRHIGCSVRLVTEVK